MTRAPELEVLRLTASQRFAPALSDRVAELCEDPGFRWGALLQAAILHEIAPLVLTNLTKIPRAIESAPPRIVERWTNQKLRNMLMKKQQARVAGQIIEFFHARGTRVMLVKGAALDAVVYDEPWYTQSGDVDLMVDQSWHDLSPADRDALETIWRRSHVELDFRRHHDVDMNRVLDIDYARMWSDARRVARWSAPAYVMSPEDMLLSACVNLCRKRYRLMKSMMAVRDLIVGAPVLDWENFGRHARASGASRIAYGAFAISRDVLGCELPPVAADALRIRAPRRAAIDGVSRMLAAQMLRTPAPPRARGRLTSHVLRLATGHLAQLRREVRAHVKRYQLEKNPSPLSRPLRERRATLG
jgi:Uncharacterised nucleotidyltransferase